MNHSKYSGKITVVNYGSGLIVAERWHGAAQYSACATVDVAKFIKHYQCDPLEAHTFYPETFTEPVDRR